jgi:hypothetical protein
VASPASYDAPTVYAPPSPSRAGPADEQQGPVCSACGHQNLPGDRFCDNCGAALNAPAGNGTPAKQAPPAEPPAPKGEPPAPTPPAKTGSADLPTAEQPALQPDAAYQAEKQRLEDEIARQQQIIAQFEQMQSMFGAAAPPAVTQGLADARSAQARAQAELDTLKGGGAAPSTPEPPAPVGAPPEPVVAPPEPPAPVVVPPEPAVAPPEPPAPVVVPPEPVVAPPPAPASVARLVLDEGGRELPLPNDKAEIIVGREDPISGIFPEIDLTPFGGEGGGVSRQHARISRSDGQWMITDLNSTNYTRVDGNKLDPSLPAPLRDGTRILFGRVAATFRE